MMHPSPSDAAVDVAHGRDAGLRASRADEPWGTHRPRGAARAILAATQGSILGWGQARRALRILFERIHSGPVDVRLWGAPVRLDPRTNMSEMKPLLRLDRYDRPERAAMHEALREAARAGRVPVFLDVGANIALYSMDAVLNGPEGTRAIAAEPQPRMIERIRFNRRSIADEGRSPIENLALVECAVGAQAGTAMLDDGGREHLARVSDIGTTAVAVRPLADILAEQGVAHVDCLKIDVEGYEGEALGPFLEHAPDALLPRRVIIEHANAGEWSRDLFALFAERGYREASRTRANAIMDRA